MEVYRIGSKVLIANEDIEGMIIGICMRLNDVTYEVVWWDHRTKRTAWLYSNEFRPKDYNKQKIGFIN